MDLELTYFNLNFDRDASITNVLPSTPTPSPLTAKPKKIIDTAAKGDFVASATQAEARPTNDTNKPQSRSRDEPSTHGDGEKVELQALIQATEEKLIVSSKEDEPERDSGLGTKTDATETASQHNQDVRSEASSAVGTRITPSRELFASLPKLNNDSASGGNLPKGFTELGFGRHSQELWETLLQDPKAEAKDLVLSMIREGAYCDVKVFIGNNATFECHSLVLKAYSEMCREIKDLRELFLPNTLVTTRAFERIYEWMLNDTAFLQYEGIIEEYEAAKFLRIPDLVQQIWAYFDDSQVFREETACLTLLEAKKFNDNEITEAMLHRIQKFFIIFVASPEFFQLTAKELCILLSSDRLGINSEIEIFYTAARWLNHNWPENQEHVVPVMKTVRFHEMPTLYTVNLHTGVHRCPELENILANKELEELIYAGFLQGNILSTANDVGVRQISDKPNITRQLIIDNNCPYHHTMKCVNRHMVHYEDFANHLRHVNAMGDKYYYSLQLLPIEDPQFVCCNKYKFRSDN